MSAEVAAPWDGRRVPVTLLGGYLGAGKTTALNELLRRTDRPITVLVNDVGSVNVDATLIRRRSGDTIELTDGCVCCSIAEDLMATFETLRERLDPPDHVVVELSGIAEPGRVAPFADSDGFRLDSIVVLVDALHLRSQLKDPLRAALIRRQIGVADVIVITKTDLVEPVVVNDITETIATVAPEVPIVVGTAQDWPAVLLDLAARRPGGVAATPIPQLFDPYTVQRVSICDRIDMATLNTLLDGLGDDVVRVKGIVVDLNNKRILVQQVGRRRRISELTAAEDQPPTDLVVIRVNEATAS